ncbi:MAG: hypothetical protein ACO3DT_07330 [Gammaproteobacteria bacterium]
MSPILKRSSIFVALMAAGLVLYMSWYNIKAERFNETAIPYLEQALPKLISWRYPELDTLLSPTAKTVFRSDKVRAAYQEYSRLGPLQSMGRPEFMGNRSETIEGLGEVELIAYQVPLQFESGPAVIKLNLASDGQRYYIHHFGIHSHIFADSDGS